MSQVCQEAARAAWPAIAGTAGKAGPPELQRTDSARGEPAFQGMRLSAKLGDAGPQQLAGSSLREGVQRMLGGEGSTPGLQASLRPGCVHLVVDALTFWVRPNTSPPSPHAFRIAPGGQYGIHIAPVQTLSELFRLDVMRRKAHGAVVAQDNHMDTVATITAAANGLVASNPLWSHGRILLQTASHAALLYNGTLCSIWHGEVDTVQLDASQHVLICNYERSLLLFASPQVPGHRLKADMASGLTYIAAMPRSWRSVCLTFLAQRPSPRRYQGISSCTLRGRRPLCWGLDLCACLSGARGVSSQTGSCEAPRRARAASARRYLLPPLPPTTVLCASGTLLQTSSCGKPVKLKML